MRYEAPESIEGAVALLSGATLCVLDDMTPLLSRTLGKNITIERSDGPATIIDGDPAQLGQVLLNLCLNAVQSQTSGGVVRVTATRDGDRVLLDVADRGPGVAADLRERLFDPYVTGRDGGSGLGLPIAARLAETMSGRVELARTGADGSVFRVMLPAGGSS